MGSMQENSVKESDAIKSELIELLNLCNYEVTINKINEIHITPELEKYVKNNKKMIDTVLLSIGRDYRIRFWSFLGKTRIDDDLQRYICKSIFLRNDKLFAITGADANSEYDDSIENIEWKCLGLNVILNHTDKKKYENLNKIRKMVSFHENWNGYNGEVFKPESIHTFQRIISEVNVQPYIAPTGRNSLLLQYHFNDETILAFELFSDKLVRACVPEGNYEKLEEETIYSGFTDMINSSWEKCNATR